MPEITMYDHKGNPIYLEAVGHGLYEKIQHDTEKGTIRTGNIVNLDTQIQCGSLFTEKQRDAYLERKSKRGNKKG